MMTAHLFHNKHDWYSSGGMTTVPVDLPAVDGTVWMACTHGYAVMDSGCTLKCVGDESLPGYMRRCIEETGQKPSRFLRDVMFEGINKEPMKSAT